MFTFTRHDMLKSQSAYSNIIISQCVNQRGKSIGRKNCSVQAFENFPLIFLSRPPKNSYLKSPKFVWTENRNPDGGLSDFPLTTQRCSHTLF